MFRFWPLYIEPFARALQPARIMEIGADGGSNTHQVLAYCKDAGCKLDVVDPEPQPKLHDLMKGFGDILTYHALPSLEALPLAEHPDLVLLDGDHNWQTVHAELTMLKSLSVQRGKAFPCVLAHDVAWPYGRRDMYYNPDALEWKHPYAHQGLFPGNPGLVELGLNSHLANALTEGGPRNGVLTAIEDFIATAPFKIHFRQLPFFNGLGILVPEARMTPALESLIDDFFSPARLLQACEALETDAMKVRARLAEAESRLARRTHSLEHARELLKRQDAKIAKMRDQGGGKGGDSA